MKASSAGCAGSSGMHVAGKAIEQLSDGTLVLELIRAVHGSRVSWLERVELRVLTREMLERLEISRKKREKKMKRGERNK